MQEVTWWPGWLCPYESIYSLSGKICYLNSVKPRAALSFLSEVSGIVTSGARVYASFSPTYRGIRKLAKSLGEPADLVRTMSLQNILGDAELHRLQTMSSWEWYCGVPFGVCPECWKIGYHSIAHTLHWISRCPIHECDLDVNWGYTKEKIWPLDEVHIRRIARELREGTFGGNSFDRESVPSSAVELIAEFASWVQSVKRVRKRSPRKVLFEVDFSDSPWPKRPEIDSIHETTGPSYYHHLAIWKPIPGKVKTFLGTSPFSAGKYVLAWPLPEGAIEAIYAAKGEGFSLETLLAVAWTTNTIAGVPIALNSLLKGNLADAFLTESEVLPELEAFSSDAVQRFMVFTGRVLLKSQVGYLSPKGSTFCIHIYDELGERLVKCGMATRRICSIATHSHFGRIDGLQLVAYELVEPWNELLMQIAALLLSAFFVENRGPSAGSRDSGKFPVERILGRSLDRVTYRYWLPAITIVHDDWRLILTALCRRSPIFPKSLSVEPSQDALLRKLQYEPSTSPLGRETPIGGAIRLSKTVRTVPQR